MRTTKVSQMDQFNQFIDRYYQPLFRFAAELCGSPARAMLLTQRTFRQAFERDHSFPVPGNVRAWLFTILFHHFLENRSRRRT